MRYLLLVFLSIVYIHLDAKSLYNRDLDEIFSRLDDAVSRHDEYREQKEERIAKMHERMSGRTSLEGQYYAINSCTMNFMCTMLILPCFM